MMMNHADLYRLANALVQERRQSANQELMLRQARQYRKPNVIERLARTYDSILALLV